MNLTTRPAPPFEVSSHVEPSVKDASREGVLFVVSVDACSRHRLVHGR